jgi:hypothetical protein
LFGGKKKERRKKKTPSPLKKPIRPIFEQSEKEGVNREN